MKIFEIRNDGLYLYGERIVKEYEDEYDNYYILTTNESGRIYYLYKQQVVNNYTVVAKYTKNITKYIEENNLKEVKIV